MKKFLSIMLVLSMLVMCFALTACTEKDEIGGADDKTGIEVGTPNNAQDETPEEPTEKEVIKMATNAYFKPYEYYEGDKIVGIDAEIAAAIAEELGMELVIEDMEFDTIITAVKGGSADFGMAGMTVTEDRLLEINFTNSYASGVQSIIVKEDSPITTVDDLYAEGAAYKVGVQQGTTGDIYSTDDFGADNVVPYNNGNNAVLALVGGSVDCVIIDNEPAKALVAANEGLKILDTSYADEDYAICVAKENTELLEKLNNAILTLTANGKIDEIVAKYIK